MQIFTTYLMQNIQFSLTAPPVVVIIWSKSITPDFCRENPYGGTYYYQHHRQSGRRFRSHCAQGPVRQTGCQSGRQTYPWKMNQEAYAGQMPHIIETAAAAGFQGLEAEICMLGPYFDRPEEVRELLTLHHMEFAALDSDGVVRQDGIYMKQFQGTESI